MILNEFYQHAPEGYQDLRADQSQPKLGKLRAARLTLRQLNKLRKMNDVRKYEYKQKLEKIQRQYATPAPEAA